MNNFMIDIETLGRIPDGAICQIAVVQFDPQTGETGAEFMVNVDPESSVKYGMTVDVDTVKWWFKQDPNVLLEVFTEDAVDLVTSIYNLTNWFNKISNLEDRIVWANWSRFDLTILDAAFKMAMYPSTWDRRNERDAMTVYKLFPHIKKEHEFVGSKHNALDDCKNQIAILHKCFKAIYGESI